MNTIRRTRRQRLPHISGARHQMSMIDFERTHCRPWQGRPNGKSALYWCRLGESPAGLLYADAEQ